MKPAANGLRGLRYRFRLTQKELAARVGMSTATIGAWESGERDPTPDQITRLANALGLPRLDVYIASGQLARAIDPTPDPNTRIIRSANKPVELRGKAMTPYGRPDDDGDDALDFWA